MEIIKPTYNPLVYQTIKSRFEKRCIYYNGLRLIDKCTARKIIAHLKLMDIDIWEFDKHKQKQILHEMHCMKMIKVYKNRVQLLN